MPRGWPQAMVRWGVPKLAANVRDCDLVLEGLLQRPPGERMKTRQTRTVAEQPPACGRVADVRGGARAEGIAVAVEHQRPLWVRDLDLVVRRQPEVSVVVGERRHAARRRTGRQQGKAKRRYRPRTNPAQPSCRSLHCQTPQNRTNRTQRV